ASPFKPKTRLAAENAALRTSADHIAAEGARSCTPHERGSLGSCYIDGFQRFSMLSRLSVPRPSSAGRGCPARAWSADRAGWHLSATAPPAAKRGEAGLATLAFQRRAREGIRLGSLGLAPQDGGHLRVGPIAPAGGGSGLVI